MRTAIYARRSTEQRGSPEARSTVRQVENARAFAKARGWQIVAEHVDEATSGATEHRQGLDGLLAAAARREFQAVVISEMKTLARELTLGLSIIKRLAQVDVLVYEYGQGRCLTPKNARERIVAALELFGADDYRETTAARVREGHKKHVELGHVVGGRLYGYQNKVVFSGTDRDGNPIRSHVVRVIDAAEAKVVRRIFEAHARGEGLKTIARALTLDGIASPRANDPGRSIKGWASSTVRAIVDRPVYAGKPEWGRRQKRDAWGTIHVTKRPESEVIRRVDESLRIVSDELWAKVQARRGAVAGRAVGFSSGRLAGRPRRGGEHALLAGLATCHCGGGLGLERGRYFCQRRRRHGAHVCPGISVPAAEADEAVLHEVEEHVLTPQAVENFLLAVDEQTSQNGERRARLEKELGDVKRREAALVAAVEGGAGDVAPIIERMKALQGRRVEVEHELKAATPAPRLEPTVLASRLAEWRRILRGSVTQARDVLQRVIRGRLRFTQLPGGIIQFEGESRYSWLFSGIFVGTPDTTPPPPHIAALAGDTRGHEAGDAERAEMEARYEAVLRGAEEKCKGVRPWRDSNPRSPP